MTTLLIRGFLFGFIFTSKAGMFSTDKFQWDKLINEFKKLSRCKGLFYIRFFLCLCCNLQTESIEIHRYQFISLRYVNVTPFAIISRFYFYTLYILSFAWKRDEIKIDQIDVSFLYQG